MEPGGADASVPPAPAIAQNTPSPDYQDRSTGLLVLGIIEIAGGALAALAVPIVLLSGVLMRQGAGAAPPLRSLTVTCLTYALLAAVLIALGIGATQARRWAWALNFILSWIWLITGVLLTILLVVMLPSGVLAALRNAATQNPGAAPVPAGLMAVIITFMIVFASVFLIILPLVFLLFYRSRNVEQTCKHRDPVKRWTDRCPLPVLALALLAATSALYYLVVGLSTPLFPFFGRYLTGLPGAAAFLVFAVVDAYVALAFYRLKVAGWWVAVIFMVFRLASSALTIGRGNLLVAYAKMGWSHEQLEALSLNPMFRGNAILWWSLTFMVIYLGFLLWVKRYFRPPVDTGYTGLSDSASNPLQPGS